MNELLTQKTTKEVAELWFQSLNKGDTQTAYGLIADDVEWENIPSTKGVSDVAPWLGKYKGKDNVIKSFDVWASKSRPNAFELYKLMAVDDEAIGFVHENATCIANENSYDLYVATYLKIRNEKIVSWRVYWDPSPLIQAYKNLEKR
ncbi:MAG: nuclear transport factor 2 family protein [Bacillota bacterium]|jgi:ketosteroid isomerase-like protein